MPQEYKPPMRYDMKICILEYLNHSIPVVKLTPRTSKLIDIDTIVYAHGNSSDLADGLRFV